MNKPKIVPSVLSADFVNPEAEIRKVEKAGCPRLHLDVMDGHPVPNITFGPIVVGAVRKRTSLYLQTHLMIERPERYLRAFKRSGADASL